jgi:hypothetical protein
MVRADWPVANLRAPFGNTKCLPKNIEYFKQGQNQANLHSTCSNWSPDYDDIFLF